MVIVANEPYPETEPMLNSDDTSENNEFCRRNSYAEAYRNITSSMKAGGPLQINSPKLACELLSTAVKVRNMPLARQCIEVLDTQLNKDNVISVISHLNKCKMPKSPSYEPSAPSFVDNESERNIDWVQELTENLRHNCLLEIDKYADFILKQKDINNLDYTDLLEITTRDTLQVSNECIVYLAIMKWAREECRRRTLQPHILNIKAVLRDLCYAPRYGLMTKKEFTSGSIDGEKGPQKSGILDEIDYRKILFYIKEKQKNRSVDELPYKLSRKRIIGQDKPKILSCRSSIRAMECPSVAKNRTTQCGTTTTCEKFLLNFLTCWAAVFD